MSKRKNNPQNQQPRRWTLQGGKVVEITQYAFAALSLRAHYLWEAQEAFLAMARNVLFNKPQIVIRNGAFLHIYHDGEKYCAESGPLDMCDFPPSCNRYDSREQALADPNFRDYATDEYQRHHAAELAAEVIEAGSEEKPALSQIPA
jgi:hypothetical protein